MTVETHTEPTNEETPVMASDPDPLEEISVSAAKLIREVEEVSLSAPRVIRDALEGSRKAVRAALGLVDGMRNKSIVTDGIGEGLRTLSAKLGEADDQYLKILASVVKTYGDDPAPAEEDESGGRAISPHADVEEEA